jgi:lysine 2,3-aminomutase
MMRCGHYLTNVSDLTRYTERLDIEQLQRVSERYAFRANDYYLGLIDWDAPGDPIRRLVVPAGRELAEFGGVDTSNESANTRFPGLQHKYRDTAVLLVTNHCGGYCRYCFRKRLFFPDSDETRRDVSDAVGYIGSHPEIADVLITGGDPLTLATSRLAEIFEMLCTIPHVARIRIGSKMPAFDPYRILDDIALQELLASTTATRPIYLMCHFDHPRELTEPARAAIALLNSIGVTCLNQCPIIQGVNDDETVLAELFDRCSDAGCPQYYVFQCRPALGNQSYEVPIVRGFSLVSKARSHVSGLSRRARYCLSHATGKIEIVGVDDTRIFARYHRAKDPADESRMLLLRRDDTAYWLDQLECAEGQGIRPSSACEEERMPDRCWS